MLASEPDSDELSPNHLIAWLFSPKNEEALLGSDLRLFLALFPGMPSTTCAAHDSPGPWENAFREPLETAPLQHSFQDANYHDQIVNERERASDGRSHCRPVCGNRTRDKWDRPRQTQNLAADHSTVKRPEKSGQSDQFRPPKRGYNRFYDTHRRAERFGTGGGRDGLLGGQFRMVAAPCATGRSRRGGPCFHDENGLRPAFRGHRAASPNERCRQCR